MPNLFKPKRKVRKSRALEAKSIFTDHFGYFEFYRKSELNQTSKQQNTLSPSMLTPSTSVACS